MSLEHNHQDDNLRISTCERCERYWTVMQAIAADPLTVEGPDLFPPSDTLPHRLWNLLVPVRLRVALHALWRKLRRRAA